MLIVLPTPHWGDALDGGAWSHWYCNQDLFPILTPCLPLCGTPWGCPPHYGLFKDKNNTRLVFDPTYLTIDMDSFPKYDWTEFYGNAKEAILSDMPQLLGKDLDVCIMCNSNYAREKRACHSCTGFLIFCNMALIDWLPSNKPQLNLSLWCQVCCNETWHWKVEGTLV